MNITMIPSSPTLVRRIRPKTDVDLPEELIELILSKCPVKSVVRFKSVSKSWQSLISDPRFSKSHRIQQARLWGDEKRFIILAKEKKLGARIYLVKSEGEYIFDLSSITNREPSLYFSEGIFRTESVLPYPSPIFNIPLCSCNGLILFAQKGNNQHYMLWNPSIRKHTIITWPWSFAPRHNFYYDPTTDDHKIVFSDENCYTVYSCNMGNWSEMKDLPPDLTPKYLYRGVSIDGRLYNLVDNGEIVCFDTRDGNLQKFGLPNNVERVVSLCVASGRLYLYGYVKDDDKGFSTWAMEKKHGSFEKWVMDNKSSMCVSRKLIDMGNEKVADLYLQDDNDGVSSVHTSGYVAFDPSDESRIFPYSENLYMHMHCWNKVAE